MTPEQQPRPTAGNPTRDLSGNHHGASAEAALFHAYSRIGPCRRTEPCACGAEITAEVGWEEAAVREHQRTPLHQAWRAWQERVGAA